MPDNVFRDIIVENVRRFAMWDKIKDGAKGLADKSIESAKEKREQKKLEEREFKDRIKQMDKDGIVYCPKCYSTNITSNKKGFSVGKAAVGAIATGGIGLLAGGIGKNKIELTCLKCGHQWKAGKK